MTCACSLHRPIVLWNAVAKVVKKPLWLSGSKTLSWTESELESEGVDEAGAVNRVDWDILRWMEQTVSSEKMWKVNQWEGEEVSSDEGRLCFGCEYHNSGSEIGSHDSELTLYHIVTVFWHQSQSRFTDCTVASHGQEPASCQKLPVRSKWFGAVCLDIWLWSGWWNLS